MQIGRRDEVRSFTTLDGSTIREVAGPSWTAARNQSLAEATVPAGAATLEHLHHRSEEVYYFIAGHGRMRLDGEEADVRAGDCVVIAPGTPHKLWAAADTELVLLCACSPPYSDQDTEMLESSA